MASIEDIQLELQVHVEKKQSGFIVAINRKILGRKLENIQVGHLIPSLQSVVKSFDSRSSLLYTKCDSTRYEKIGLIIEDEI